MRQSTGVAFLSRGFRPFFFGAGVFGAAALLVWLVALAGAAVGPCGMAARDWHVHEMLFGYFAAAMSGFLLTAVPNWTGRLPIAGRPLLALLMLWLVARVAAFFSCLAPWVAAIVDVSYLIVLAGLIWREIIAAGNRRNAAVAVLVSLVALADAWWHVAVLLGDGAAALAERLVLAVAAGLIMLIGGRIVPSFTRNWLMKQGRRDEAELPASFGPVDRIAIILGGAALAIWVATGEGALSAPFMLVAGVALCARLARWKGHATLREPLVWILHVGYFWVAAWFVLMSLAGWGAWPVTDALHALTAGAILTMTLAVMTRASLGHSGRPLKADGITTVIYLLAIAGGVVRTLAQAWPWPLMASWHLSGALSASALALFAVAYVPTFFQPRKGNG